MALAMNLSDLAKFFMTIVIIINSLTISPIVVRDAVVRGAVKEWGSADHC
jgi:hypothetical protein